MELHGVACGATWSHRINFKYYRSRMQTLYIKSRNVWSCMEPLCKLQILQEPHEDPLIEVERYMEPIVYLGETGVSRDKFQFLDHKSETT